MSVILLVLVAVGFFVFGVLFGRKNKNKVEQGVAAGEKVVSAVESKLSKK